MQIEEIATKVRKIEIERGKRISKKKSLETAYIINTFAEMSVEVAEKEAKINKLIFT